MFDVPEIDYLAILPLIIVFGGGLIGCLLEGFLNRHRRPTAQLWLSIITLGGQYRSDRMDTIGPLATSTLDQLRGYKAFLGADGLSMEFGVTAADIESAHLYRMAVRNARESILLVDHAKFLSPSLFKIVEWDAISRVITDSEPPAPWREFLDSHGIETIHPSSGPAEAESGNG